MLTVLLVLNLIGKESPVLKGIMYNKIKICVLGKLSFWIPPVCVRQENEPRICTLPLNHGLSLTFPPFMTGFFFFFCTNKLNSIKGKYSMNKEKKLFPFGICT